MMKVCTEVEIPKKESVKAALSERSDNLINDLDNETESSSSKQPEMSVSFKKLWQNGRTLKVAFIDNTPPDIRNKIIKYMSFILPYINLKFDFVTGKEGDIRITTTPGAGSWSYVGTDALGIAKDKPTMNFGWLKPGMPEWEFQQVVLHETCHALGAEHEQQHPNAHIPYNKEKVYEYYQRTNGWNRAKVDQAVLTTLNANAIKSNGYDPDSIMHYEVSKELTDGRWATDWDNDLSMKDKDMLRKSYPKS